jgi:predicted amidophosphoribosyltransferase
VTAENAARKIGFQYEGSLTASRHVLIIDDVWSRGTTVMAVVSHLCMVGLQAGVPITVFAPLRMAAGHEGKELLKGVSNE